MVHNVLLWNNFTLPKVQECLVTQQRLHFKSTSGLFGSPGKKTALVEQVRKPDKILTTGFFWNNFLQIPFPLCENQKGKSPFPAVYSNHLSLTFIWLAHHCVEAGASLWFFYFVPP